MPLDLPLLVVEKGACGGEVLLMVGLVAKKSAGFKEIPHRLNEFSVDETILSPASFVPRIWIVDKEGTDLARRKEVSNLTGVGS
jgi:hypothetical protein